LTLQWLIIPRRSLVKDAIEIGELLRSQRYIADRQVVMSVFLAVRLGKPLLIEGRAGVGKTEIAKALAGAFGTRFIRLQCYEGLDANTTLYEWNYAGQMLRIKLEEQESRTIEEKEAVIFGEEFLLKRPLLRSITDPEKPPVLLVDEVDRADEEFEAFLLEILSDFTVTIPEIGTIEATHRPYVILTSNRTRDLSDALKRRCLYLWLDYPSLEKELQIVREKVPGIPERFAAQIAAFMQELRYLELNKTPGVAETLDFAMSLVTLRQQYLSTDVIRETIGTLLKNRDDVEALLCGGKLGELVDNARGSTAHGQRDAS
jgi:MoxR-like ATPase